MVHVLLPAERPFVREKLSGTRYLPFFLSFLEGERDRVVTNGGFKRYMERLSKKTIFER